jgi:hypothetical protein
MAEGEALWETILNTAERFQEAPAGMLSVVEVERMDGERFTPTAVQRYPPWIVFEEAPPESAAGTSSSSVKRTFGPFASATNPAISRSASPLGRSSPENQRTTRRPETIALSAPSVSSGRLRDQSAARVQLPGLAASTQRPGSDLPIGGLAVLVCSFALAELPLVCLCRLC